MLPAQLSPPPARLPSRRPPLVERRSRFADAQANRENLLRIVALNQRLPELIIVPAHHIRAFAKMPQLFRAACESRTSCHKQGLWYA
jgi:hypothetical protein